MPKLNVDNERFAADLRPLNLSELLHVIERLHSLAELADDPHCSTTEANRNRLKNMHRLAVRELEKRYFK